MYMCEPAFAQQYVQKQESQIVNILTNPGFESGKTGWTFSNPATVEVVSGTQALFGAVSLKFTPVSATATTISSGLITVPKGLEGEGCQAVFHYRTNEATNYFVGRVLDASGTILGTVDLTPKIVMGVPTEDPTSQSVDFDCPYNKKIEQQIWQDDIGGYITADGMHLGSKTGGLGNAQDIADALGYVPADQDDVTALEAQVTTNTADIASVSGTVAAVSSTVNTLNAASGTYMLKDNNLSDVASATIARDNLGLGDVATEDVVPTTKGGTGVSSTSTGDLLVGSGTTWVKKSVGERNQVFTARDGVSDWKNIDQSGGVNFAIANPSFESGVTGYVTSGTSTMAQGDRSSDGVNFIESDRYYAEIFASTVDHGRCRVDTIPQNFENSTVETSFNYRNHQSTASGTFKVLQTNGTSTVSTTVTLAAGVANTDPYTEFKMWNSVTSGTVTTCWLKYSGTTDFDIDNVYVGSSKSMKSGAIVGPWQRWTPTFTAFGTVTNIEMWWRQNGDGIDIKGKYTTGTVVASKPSFSLPNSFLIDSNRNPSGTSLMGRQNRNISAGAGAGEFYNYLTQDTATNANLVYFSSSNNSRTPTSILTDATVTFGNSEGQSVLQTWIPIQGMTTTGVSFDGRCSTDLSCINDFTANVSAGGAVTNENDSLDWLNGNCTNASPYVCTFKTGVFLSAPHCSIQSNNGGGSNKTYDLTITSSSVSVQQREASTGTATNNAAFIIKCSKSTDYVTKREIIGYFSSLPKTVTAKVGGGTRTTVCSSNPCTVYDNFPSGSITGTSFNSTGNYTVSFAPGTWRDENYQCFFSGNSAASGSWFRHTPTVSQTVVVADNHTAVQNSRFDLMCVAKP